MKAADVAEILASNGMTPEQAIEFSAKYSARCEAIVVNGQVEAIWGYTEISPETAVPWMLSSEALVADARQLVVEGRRIIGGLKERYTMLYNYVDARNRASLEWLQAIGFSAKAMIPAFGIAKIPFIQMVA